MTPVPSLVAAGSDEGLGMYWPWNHPAYAPYFFFNRLPPPRPLKAYFSRSRPDS